MKKQILVTVFAFCYLMLPSQVQAKNAGNFSNLFFFGDSLTDTGNVFNITGGAIPPSEFGYFQGRITNGLNWADFLAQDLGLSFQPITDGIQPGKGINFAYSGATSGAENLTNLDIPGLGALGLQGQISKFQDLVNDNNLSVDPDALYIIWAGANDYIPYGDNTILTDPSVAVNNISTAIEDLVAVGAKNIMVANLPDLGKIPLALAADEIQPGTSALLTDLSDRHNQGLKKELKQLKKDKHSDVDFFNLDIDRLIDRATKHPNDFGFTNTTEACLLVGCTAAEAANYLFWDEVHPTTVAHQFIAEKALKALHIKPTNNFKLTNSIEAQSLIIQSVPEPNTIGGLTFIALATGVALKRKNQKVF